MPHSINDFTPVTSSAAAPTAVAAAAGAKRRALAVAALAVPVAVAAGVAVVAIAVSVSVATPAVQRLPHEVPHPRVVPTPAVVTVLGARPVGVDSGGRRHQLALTEVYGTHPVLRYPHRVAVGNLGVLRCHLAHELIRRWFPPRRRFDPGQLDALSWLHAQRVEGGAAQRHERYAAVAPALCGGSHLQPNGLFGRCLARRLARRHRDDGSGTTAQPQHA
mmetsp:Transcript_74471/g.198146  ORF Transcript_74471/g.198146 Transcript_74471/m.198146 type:complete len:219 (+) Transcript_74471:198-854(+)